MFRGNSLYRVEVGMRVEFNNRKSSVGGMKASLRLGAAIALALTAGSSVWAAPLYWDANGTAAGAGAAPTGTWGTDSFWNSDSTGGNAGTFTTATISSDDLAFVAGAAADSGNNAYTVSLNGNQAANSLTFASTGAVTVGDSSTTITLSGGITVPDKAYGTTNNAANPTINSKIALSGNQTFAVSRSTLTLNGTISGTGNLTISGNGDKIFNTANTYAGTTTISGTVTTLAGAAGSLGTGDVTISGASTSLTFNHIADYTFSNNLLGGGYSAALIKADSNTLTLTGDNSTLTGGVQVKGGVLKIASVTQNLGGTYLRLGNSSSAATLLYTGTGDTFTHSLQLSGTTGGAVVQNDGTGALVFTGLITTAGDGSKTFTLQGSNTGNNEIQGIISDKTSSHVTRLTKAGAGTWILSGANDYTGATSVTGGKLIVNGSLGNTAVTVDSGATLGGSGSIGGSVVVNGTLAPGNSPGTLSLNNTLTLGSDATTAIELGGTALSQYDRVVGITDLTLDGTINVTPVNSFSPALNNSFDLLDWTGALSAGGFNVGSDLVLPALGGGLAWDTTSFLTNGTISVVPEPSVIALVGLAGFAGLRRRRR
jgi:autotransporter-associated beta strand protein